MTRRGTYVLFAVITIALGLAVHVHGFGFRPGVRDVTGDARWAMMPTLDAVRDTIVGRLVLGTGFDPRDLLAYAIGALVAVVIDAWLRRDHLLVAR